MLHRREQERPEPPAFAPGRGDIVLLEEPREKVLCEVLRPLCVVAAPADECIERIPIRLAEPFQRRATVLRTLRRAGDDAPPRGKKPPVPVATTRAFRHRLRPHVRHDTEV